MRTHINQLALRYVEGLAGTNPNADISLFENEYNAFIEGAKSVLPSDEEVNEYIKTLPYYGLCTHEHHEGIEEGINWLKQ